MNKNYYFFFLFSNIFIVKNISCQYANSNVKMMDNTEDNTMSNQLMPTKTNPVESYETKILRARAYVDILSMSEPSLSFPSISTFDQRSPHSSSFEPYLTSISNHYKSKQFTWMHPYELYECDQ